MRWSWPELALYKIEDSAIYDQRMEAFGTFYAAFYDGQRTYTIEPDKQVNLFELPDLGIVLVGFSSCHDNDLLNRRGAIHPECVASAGSSLRKICRSYNPLRIAVWHHNTEGPPIESDYMVPDVVQNLIDGGFSLGFHGHQHRPQFLDTRFRHGPDRHITVISAGTLCGGPAYRFGRAYNVVEIDTAANSGRLHVREMQNDNLQMPIWGPRPLSSHRKSYQDFKFEQPPKPFVRPDRETVELARALELFETEDYRGAADALKPLSDEAPLARRLLLECLIKLDDASGLVELTDPPGSPAEAIALMDALRAQHDDDRLAAVLDLEQISTSNDPSVIEIREKYKARLSK